MVEFLTVDSGSEVAKKDRRTQIRRAAAKLFEERGYHGTTMDDLADKLRVNKATVYYHYPSKDAVLGAIYNEPADELLRVIHELPADASPVVSLASLLRCLMKMLEATPHEIAVYCQEMRWLEQWLSPRASREVRAKQDEFTQYVVELVRRGIDEGTFRDTNAKVAAFGIIGTVTWAYQWFKPGGPQSADEVADILINLTLGGLCVDVESLSQVPGLPIMPGARPKARKQPSVTNSATRASELQRVSP